MAAHEVEQIFWEAAQIPDGDQRAAYLDRACAGDAGLRERVEQLLQARVEAESFLEAPAPLPGTTIESTGDECPGTVLGPYKLLEQIGEGGFGRVFMAEQQQPLRRKVAVKVLKPGMDSKQVIARFEVERQALALMDHPHIARVLDAGTTVRGRPYFVMELVRGVPITAYCDQNHLTPRERLALFLPVCQAVQHAHQKGVIHRDLKPSNVLVTLHDGIPVVKVIDFGIAKALGQQLTDKTLFTGFAQMIGTPLYMSPEQAEMSGLDIDTRSDLYSLGVLLYELLTGTTPVDKNRLQQAAFDEIRRIIREEEPERPSTRISTLGQAASTASANRGSDPRRLSQLFRGELDWIVMKALEKDRNRRYETAASFAADVQRYLHDEPVQACPPSTSYKLRKFARKHRLFLATAAAFALLLLAGIVVSSWQAWRALGAEKQAQTERANADTARTLAESRFALAQRAVDRYLNEVTADPALKNADLHQLRKKLLETAVPFYRELADERPDDPEQQAVRGRAYLRLARLRAEMGEIKDALSECGQAVTLFTSLARDFPASVPYRRDLAGSLHHLARWLRESGQLPQAQQTERQALELREQLARDSAEDANAQLDVCLSHEELGHELHDLGKTEEGLTEILWAVGLVDKLSTDVPTVPEIQWHRSKLHMSLGVLLADDDQLSEGRKHFDTALSTLEKLPSDYPSAVEHSASLFVQLNNLGSLLEDVGEKTKNQQALQESRGYCLRAIAVADDLLGRFPAVPTYRDYVAIAHFNLGNTLRELGDKGAARAAFEQAVTHWERVSAQVPSMPQYGIWLGRVYNNLGNLFADNRDWKTAHHWLSKSLRTKEQLAERYPAIAAYRDDVALTCSNLCSVLDDSGRLEAVEPELRTYLALARQRTLDKQAWVPFQIESFLGASLLGQKKYAASEPLLLSGYQGMKQHEALMPADLRDQLTRAAERLVQLYEAWGKPDKVAEWRQVLQAQRDSGKQAPKSKNNALSPGSAR
jgi:serine/threonine protein kinase/tetratricopeptide (TPR) repeat protein